MENKEEGKLDNGTTASATTEENVEAKKAETASAGSTDAPTDIVQDSPDKDSAGVAVISEVLSPSSQTSPIAEEPKVQEQKVESPVTEAAAAPEKEAAPLPVETKPEVPSTLEIKPDISAAEVKSSPLIEKTESPAVVEAKAEPPVTEEKKVETKESPVAVEPKVESPVEAKVETLVAAQVETPVVEEPKAEKQDTPVAEEPKIQSPIEEQPKVESPVAEKVESPVAEKVESPVAEKVESPVAEKVESPVAEKVESPVAEKVESPVVEEQKVTTPIAEEPKVAAPVAEAPVAEKLKEATSVEEIPPEPVSEAVVESPVEESKADSLPSPPESPTASVPELADVPVPESSDVPELTAVPVPESPVEAVKLEEIKNEVTEMASPDDAKPVLEVPASPVETLAVNDILAEDVKIESQAPITNGVNGVTHELTNGTVNGEEQEDHTEVATIEWKKGGDQVYVLGDFNQWKDKCILHKQDDVFSTKIKLNKGVYHLKFDVDGIETVDDSQPTTGLEGLGQVNILKV